MINAKDDPQAILDQCLQSNHTRLPVYRDDPDNIIGVVHAKDLLRAMHKLVMGGDASAPRRLPISTSATWQ